MLLDEARRLGAGIRFDCDVSTVDFESPFVVLSDGERVHADVIVGADGKPVPTLYEDRAA